MMNTKLPFDPTAAYKVPDTVVGRIMKALYGENAEASITSSESIADCVSERVALLQSASDALVENQRLVCKFDMRYAMMWAYWKASAVFEAEPTLEHALILCFISVCETLLKAIGYEHVRRTSEDDD